MNYDVTLTQIYNITFASDLQQYHEDMFSSQLQYTYTISIQIYNLHANRNTFGVINSYNMSIMSYYNYYQCSWTTL